MGEFVTLSPGDDTRRLLKNARWLNKVTNLIDPSSGAPRVGAGVGRGVTVWLKNTGEGEDAKISTGGIAVLGDVVITPEDRAGVVFETLTFKCTAPDDDTTASSLVAFALEPIPAGKIRAGIMPDAAWVKVDVTNEDHKYAVVGTEPILKSAAAGRYPIAFKETGEGEKWAVILLASGGGVNAVTNFGLVMTTADANFGSPGTYVAIDMTGTPVDADGEILILDELDEDYDADKVEAATREFYSAHEFSDCPSGSRVQLWKFGGTVPRGAFRARDKTRQFGGGGGEGVFNGTCGLLTDAPRELRQLSGYAENKALVTNSSDDGPGMGWAGEECPPEEE